MKKLLLLLFLAAGSAEAQQPAWIQYYPPASVGGAAVGGTNVWTGDNRFTDSLFFLRDDGDLTKLLQFQLSGITTGTTRTLTVPNVSSTICVAGLDNTWATTQTFTSGGAAFPTDQQLLLGTNQADITMRSVQTPDSVVIGLPATSLSLIIAERADFASDWAHALQTNPTLYIQSADGASTTKWLSLAHNTANGVISTGLGPVALPNGSAVASATALPLPTGNIFHVTGTTTITSITTTGFSGGMTIVLIFDGVLTFTDGNNLKLAGNFVTTADDTITLAYDGTNFYEVERSVN